MTSHHREFFVLHDFRCHLHDGRQPVLQLPVPAVGHRVGHGAGGVLRRLAVFFPPNAAYQIAFGTFYISCFTFTSYVNWKLNKERYNVFLNALEAKIQHKEATERGKALLRLSQNRSPDRSRESPGGRREAREYWSDWQSFGTSFAAILDRRRLLQEVQRLLRPPGRRPLPDRWSPMR